MQLHFHAPSEHMYGGKQYELEMHIVYKSLDIEGKLGVVSVMFDSREEYSGVNNGKSNTFIESLKVREFVKSMVNGAPSIQ